MTAGGILLGARSYTGKSIVVQGMAIRFIVYAPVDQQNSETLSLYYLAMILWPACSIRSP